MPLTDEKMVELCETVATISADLKNCISQQTTMAEKLDEHTKADSDNFEKLSGQLDVLTANHNQKLGAAKFRATIWSTITSGGLIAAWELVRTVLLSK
jgi:hypothetical protein